MEVNHHNQTQTDRILRPGSIKLWKDNARTKTGSESFSIDTAKLWNNSPEVIKNATTIGMAKNAIKNYCKSLEPFTIYFFFTLYYSLIKVSALKSP